MNVRRVPCNSFFVNATNEHTATIRTCSASEQTLTHAPITTNAILTLIEMFRGLQDKFLQFILFIMNKIFVSSNQIEPAEVLELQDVV